MKIARPLSALFKKSPKKEMDKSPLQELAETRFRVQQMMGADEFSKGKWSQPRILAICEEGIKLISENEEELIQEIPWSSILQFNLKESWTEWEIVLKDRRKLFFKCQKAFDLHMATDHILDGLIRNNRSQGYFSEF
ncbi:hypothetical protein SAMD00019534_087720 [Acytostelium subglobosum LB1]|uniref:hypothetical protein n=1 Tax=Acytostelium subglobosum LB1 TaxID=1410327 RepID=UPI000644E7BF|nr:hypothetical protein SAMD00019534_087720 [Acytostelium subglobosum LB1]GAM25597.1 hypothetical protein SAMD00019534_087720 [Acytostelium subglobosum LB1]|eukprot:XP_012751583.1 hypothetical protein SAMD00019534_087720 [Acytostelium subglobosum LB1]